MSFKKLIEVTKSRFLFDLHIMKKHCKNFVSSFKSEKKNVIAQEEIGGEEEDGIGSEKVGVDEGKDIGENVVENAKNDVIVEENKKQDVKIMDYKDKLKKSVRKATLHTKFFRDEEVKLVIKHLTNRMRVNGFVSEEDIDKICVNLDQEKREVVFDILSKRHIEYSDKRLQYSKYYTDNKEKRMQELLSLISIKESVIQSSDYVYVSKLYHEALVASNFPEQIKPGWIETLLQFDGNMDFVVNIGPTEVQSVVLYLERKQNALEDEMYQLTKLGRKDIDLKSKIEFIRDRIKQLKKQEIQLHSLSLYIINKGIDPDEVRRSSKRTIQRMMAEGIECKYATHYQGRTFRSSIPVGVDFLKGREIVVPSKVLKDAFIFKKVEGLE